MERTESVAPTNMVSRSSFVADPLFIRLEPVIGSGFGEKKLEILLLTKKYMQIIQVLIPFFGTEIKVR